MSDWSEKDYGLLLGALTGVHADSESTKRLIRRGGEEANPLIGRNPSNQDLDKAAIVSTLLGTGGAMALPKEWRRPLMGAWAGLEHGLAYKNDRMSGKEKPTKLEEGREGPLMMAALGGLLGHYLNDSDSGISVEKKDGAISLVFNKKF